MGDVAHDQRAQPAEVAAVVGDRRDVEKRLRRVLVGAVTCVDDGHIDPLGDARGCPARLVTAHEGVDTHGAEGANGVAEGLALGQRRALLRERDRVGAEAFRRDLEADPGAGRVLEEAVGDRLAPQCRDLRDRTAAHVAELAGEGEDGLDALAAEVVDREEAARHVAASTDSET